MENNLTWTTESPPTLSVSMYFSDANLVSIIMYSVILVISAVGNLASFVSLLRLRNRKKSPNVSFLLLNLAIADLFVTFVIIPFEIGWNFTVSWEASDCACRVLTFCRAFGIYLSGFIIVSICMDRYLSVIHPLRIAQKYARGRKFAAFAWISSFLCSLPQSFIFHVETHPDFPWYKQCVTFNSFSSKEYELAYNLFVFSCMYLIPILTIVTTYTQIIRKVHGLSSEEKSSICQRKIIRRSSRAIFHRAKLTTIKMTLYTAIGFTLCWTPYNVIALWYFFDPASAQLVDWRVQKFLFVFSYSNSCLNPIIYGWFSAKKSIHADSSVRQV